MNHHDYDIVIESFEYRRNDPIPQIDFSVVKRYFKGPLILTDIEKQIEMMTGDTATIFYIRLRETNVN